MIKAAHSNKQNNSGEVKKICRKIKGEMDGILQQVGLPVLGIVAAAAVTFYVVSFSELREKSFRDLDDAEDSGGSAGFKSSLSSRQRRARRNAEKKQANK